MTPADGVQPRAGLRSRLAALLRRPFVRNVATVATGAAATQAISMAFAPLITRLYGPEAYGQQGVFVSVVSLLGIAAALGYPTAIVLPRHDADARALVQLSMAIGVLMSLLVAVGLVWSGPSLLALLHAQVLADSLMLIPLGVFGVVSARVLAQWLIRCRAYRLGAVWGALTTALVNAVKVGWGLLGPSALALIAIQVVGGLAGTLLTWLGWRRGRGAPSPETGPDAVPALDRIVTVAARHRDFPLLRAPQDLINALSQTLPLLMLAGSFGAAAAGHYSIAITVLGVPAALIGTSIMSVFYPRINDALHEGEDARSLIRRATVGMAGTGALPFLLVFAAGPWLFAFVFGEPWREAGVYARCLAPWLFMQYINQPAVAAIPALRLQRGLLVYELFSTGSKVLALWLGFAVFGDDVVAVALFAASGVVAYAWLIGWVLRRSAVPPASTGARGR